VAKTSNSSKKRATSNKSMKKTAAVRAAEVGEKEVTIDRRRGGRRGEESDSADEAALAAPQLERRQKVNRRRQIDPTTCERDYTELEVEFMNALDQYKRQSGRMFPTCSEVLEVIHSLGYVKLSPAAMAGEMAAPTSSAKPMPITAPTCGGLHSLADCATAGSL
jgi:hypothetical protein